MRSHGISFTILKNIRCAIADKMARVPMGVIQVIKAFGQGSASFGHFADSVNFFHDSTLDWWRQSWFWMAGFKTVLTSTLLGTLPVGAWLYMNGKIALPIFLAGIIILIGFISGLIRENIRMGNPEATDAEIEKAAKAANCHEFIIRLEQSYDTLAGDAGDRLSGGERQRITIACAMLKPSSVVILN